MAHWNKNSAVNDYAIREERLCVPFSITANATPASKSNSNDLPAAMVLSLEGQTSTASAIDSGCNFTTESDSTGIFGVLVHNLGTVNKLLNVDCRMLSSGTVALSSKGASSSGVTASGNIAVSVDWDGSLATTSLSGALIVDYNIVKA